MNPRHLTNEEKLDEIYELTLENHKMLKSIHRQTYFANALRVVYWLVIIGALGGAYYFVRPFVGLLSRNPTQVDQTVSDITTLKNQLPEAKLINQILEGLKKSAKATVEEAVPQE